MIIKVNTRLQLKNYY